MYVLLRMEVASVRALLACSETKRYVCPFNLEAFCAKLDTPAVTPSLMLEA